MIELKVISPESEVYSGSVEAVFLPGTLGEFEVLPHHAPIISSLTAGQIRYRQGGKMQSIRIASGFARLENDRLTVCVEL